MTIIPLLNLASCGITFYMAVMVYYEDRKNLANQLFSLGSLAVTATAFVTFMGSYVENPANILFWVRMKFVAVFILPFLLHYVLVFTESKWLRYKFTYVLLYLPPVFLATSYFYAVEPVRYFWGYGYHWKSRYLELFRYILLSADSIIMVLLCYLNSLKATAKNKLQSKYMSLTFLATILIAIVSYTISGLLKHPLPEYITLTTSIPLFFILRYLMKRYQIFILNPATAMPNIITTMTDTFLLVEPGGNIVNINPAALNLLGYRESELVGHSLATVFQDDNEKNNFLQQTIINHSVKNYETGFRTKDHQSIAVSLSSSLLKDNNGEVAGIVIIARDVTDTQEMARKMSYQATHDPLTGLNNRNYFEEQLQNLIEVTKSGKKESALLFLDLDRFKIVNDTCGHFAGDNLMKELSQLMKQQVRGSDIIARIGGDEFGIILENCPVDSACKIAEKICQVIHDFRFVWETQLFTCGVSIGVIQIDENSSNLDKVISAADQACYAAKELGGNQIHLYFAKDQELTERQGEMQWISVITKAFEDERFCLHSQVIMPVNQEDQRFRFEVLIRMLDEKGELIFPNAFLPAAQRYNLMTAIDKWVVQSFFKFFAEYYRPQFLHNNFTCNINLSGASLNDSRFLDFIKNQYQQYQIPPGAICFEITETIALANFTKAISFIEELKQLGIEFALDDFGNGFMSFNYLKHLPVDYVKIDGAFIKNIIQNPVDLVVVESINQIAHMMNVKTVAEFVETEVIYNKLKHVGVDLIQGYWLGKPIPLNQLCAQKKTS